MGNIKSKQTSEEEKYKLPPLPVYTFPECDTCDLENKDQCRIPDNKFYVLAVSKEGSYFWQEIQSL